MKLRALVKTLAPAVLVLSVIYLEIVFLFVVGVSFRPALNAFRAIHPPFQASAQSIESQGEEPIRSIKVSQVPVSKLNKNNTTVIKVSNPKVDYIYIPKDPPPFSQIAKNNECKYAVNASYFGGTYTDAVPAGWLSIWGANLGETRESVLQTHVVQYNKESRSSEIVPSSSFKTKASKKHLEFQTGPLIIKNGLLEEKLAIGSKGARESHMRTLIGIDGESSMYLITVREEVDLTMVGNYLLSLDIFAGEDIDIINLDGGHSVALFNQDNPGMNFNEGGILPMVLCFKS
ncbi:MAG TPA: hypothetical protein ENI23_13735 [bacterium]|nr:hypothetical protein [bacterium]